MTLVITRFDRCNLHMFIYVYIYSYIFRFLIFVLFGMILVITRFERCNLHMFIYVYIYLYIFRFLIFVLFGMILDTVRFERPHFGVFKLHHTVNLRIWIEVQINYRVYRAFLMYKNAFFSTTKGYMQKRLGGKCFM